MESWVLPFIRTSADTILNPHVNVSDVIMSGEAARKAWVVAASIGAVETMKDQGVARWNRPLLELDQHARTKILASYYNAGVNRSVFKGAEYYSSVAGECSLKRSHEESMNMVMEVSCFGPNTVRF